MHVLQRADLTAQRLPGRRLQRAVGAEGPAHSQRMSIGFARYDAESGVMEPHAHAEETVVVLDAHEGWVRCGPAAEQLGEDIPLIAGTVLHIPEGEWHVFAFAPGGFVDILFCYGQTTGLRPEDLRARKRITLPFTVLGRASFKL